MLNTGWAVVIFFAHLFGWQAATAEHELCFIVPEEMVLVSVAHQPDCPIEFVRAESVAFLNGGGKDLYRLRNRATKPIKGYRVAIVNSEGTFTEDSVTLSQAGKNFSPGEIWASSSRDNLSIVPLTDQLREKYKLNGGMKVVKIFMVVRVEFADGSLYNAEPQYISLRRFFEKNPTTPENKDDRKKTRE